MQNPRVLRDVAGRPFWERRIPAAWGGRTSITLTVLRRPDVNYARFVLKNGGVILITMDELRRALVGRSPRKGQITFTIDVTRHRVEDIPVLMLVAGADA